MSAERCSASNCRCSRRVRSQLSGAGWWSLCGVVLRGASGGGEGGSGKNIHQLLHTVHLCRCAMAERTFGVAIAESLARVKVSRTDSVGSPPAPVGDRGVG